MDALILDGIGLWIGGLHETGTDSAGGNLCRLEESG